LQVENLRQLSWLKNRGAPQNESMNRFTNLWDYRSRVNEMYRRVREAQQLGLDPRETLLAFRASRDELFRSHPQSALDDAQKARFRKLEYFEHDPALRLILPLEPATSSLLEFELPEDGLVRAERFAQVNFKIKGQDCRLSLFWLLGYGGGVFVPFADATSGTSTYGGGRYLLDTIKHADFGQDGERVVIDFNYAYNPSCAYNPRWVCPLSPLENRLPISIRAGEKMFQI
jgi:uncharacterized protein